MDLHDIIYVRPAVGATGDEAFYGVESTLTRGRRYPLSGVLFVLSSCGGIMVELASSLASESTFRGYWYLGHSGA